eukprot:g5599.t1
MFQPPPAPTIDTNHTTTASTTSEPPPFSTDTIQQITSNATDDPSTSVTTTPTSSQDSTSVSKTPFVWGVADMEGVWYIYAPHWATRTAGILVSLEDTFIKRTTEMSWELPNWGKRQIRKGQELRIATDPTFVKDEKEKTRHKWIHLHRCIKLGEMEQAKAELLEAQKKLSKANVKLTEDKKVDLELEKAQSALLAARQNVVLELRKRKELGLEADVDPFSEDFDTSPTDDSVPSPSKGKFTLEQPEPEKKVNLVPFAYVPGEGVKGGIPNST